MDVWGLNEGVLGLETLVKMLFHDLHQLRSLWDLLACHPGSFLLILVCVELRSFAARGHHRKATTKRQTERPDVSLIEILADPLFCPCRLCLLVQAGSSAILCLDVWHPEFLTDH